MAKKIGVMLSGCGNRDGSEIHESVLTLLAIDRNGAESVCMAPDIPQSHVINFLTGEISRSDKRNALAEAARIARGRIKNMKEIHAYDFDALIIPGGSGAASTLSNFNQKGENCQVDPEVSRVVRETLNGGKPIGVICIAPVILAKIAGETGRHVRLTIGNDPDTAKAIEAMGGTHVEATASEVVIDETNRVVSTPAYMVARSISEVGTGIDKLVNHILRML